ncbi:MAG: PBSX family phage terminase large subunit [Oscillospiraceae bacterium]|nr:PBSX family phage terminase large subunit [Oscillospiraceae bacterium]
MKYFSEKQMRVMRWWMPQSKDCRYDAVICDGAVRSGKTLALGLGFFLWAMCSFDKKRFGLCGKTRMGFQRNVLAEILPRLKMLGMNSVYKPAEYKLTVRFAGRQNDFYIFGGCDERAASLIQGITFAGVLLDEVVLMPRSFVEQACARCSVAGSRLWFSCNPEGPQHWFYREWVLKAEEKNCLHLRFTMEDNPSLSQQVRKRYKRLYSGVFYRRFILGQWTAAEGRVYDFFDTAAATDAPTGKYEQWYISCDYGTVNPASFGLWGQLGGVWYRVKEFYFDSRREGRQMTDEEYAEALRTLAGEREIKAVIVDPSAASFIETLRRRGWTVRKADNDVLRGIRMTADALKSGRVVICSACRDCLREMDLYVWDGSAGHDRVKKQNDHAMDDMRYFVTAVAAPRSGLRVCTARRENK